VAEELAVRGEAEEANRSQGVDRVSNISGKTIA
jgi:hypothetical protein